MLLYCLLVMVMLGISDGLRGVFLPVFEGKFLLTHLQSSLIIMASYAGNLLFLTFGGRVLDRVPRKGFLTGITLIWMAALVLYVLTSSYWVLVVGMVCSLGASTMLSSALNITAPMFFMQTAMMVNLFNFAQGVGLVTVQNLGGRTAGQPSDPAFSGWHWWNLGLVIAGILSLVLLAVIRFPAHKPDAEAPAKTGGLLKNPAAPFLLVLFGTYYIAEHGLENWMVTYGSQTLGMTAERAALYLSLFYGGITAGRLLFAPLVQKLGELRSMAVFTVAGTVLYVAGILLGRGGIVLLCLSGLAFSILYPTLVVTVSLYYPASQNGAAFGFIAGIATLFDVVFNLGFGALADAVGFSRAILILPASIVVFCVTFLMMQRRCRPLKGGA